MPKEKNIKHFCYCDVNGINSIYSQLFGNTEEISIKDSKKRELSGSVGLPYILQGFLKTNLSGEYSRDWSTEQSSKVTITIEDKVRSILRGFKDDESKKIDRWSDTECLVAGHATIVNYQRWTNRITDFFRSYADIKYPDFESFLKDIRYNPEFERMWSEFTNYTCDNVDFSRQRLPIRPFLAQDGSVIKCIAVDLKYPVLVHYSSDKLLISASEHENWGLVEGLPQTGILGILRKADTNLYTIKPLAMWHDLSYEAHPSFMDTTSRFLERKKSEAYNVR